MARDSELLAGLQPAELVLIDLPEKREQVKSWLPALQASTNVRYVEGNLLYLSPDEFESLGTFDLIWCLGVPALHNAEQLRLIRKLRMLCASDGTAVLETQIERSRRPMVGVVGQRRPWGGVQTMTHVPSTSAVIAWMEMAGFGDVRREPILSRLTSRQRAVVTGRARGDAYRSYARTGLNPDYTAGDAT